MNPLLYGHDPEARIVAVRQLDDSTMRVYFRDEKGITTRDEKFFPFFYLADDSHLRGFTRAHWLKRLEGSLYYQFLCAFEEWPVMWDALRHILESYNRSALTKVSSYTELEIIHLTPDPVMQFLMQTGKTLFKDLAFEDLHRLQLDIETFTSPPHRFSNASRLGDRTILIALSDNRGWEHLIDGKKLSERDMLTKLVEIIQKKDPDVIEGHNIFGFDLPYLQTRAKMAGIPLAIGRDGTLPRSFDVRGQAGDTQSDHSFLEIPGRHVIDTLLLVQSYDASRRTMESYGLKYAARFFGLASADRTYIEGSRISWAWENEPSRLKDYSLDDVREVRALSEHLSGVLFYLTSILPASYAHVARMGSATKIEHLMVREYLRQKHSVPRPSEGAQTTGGYTDLFYTGVLGPILHVDIESLYPSIMLGRQIGPASDALTVFPQLLKDLTARRLEAKRAMKKATDDAERSHLDATQGSLKILINSFYGYLGYTRGMFNDFAAADRVTTTGQQLLRQMIAFIGEQGGRVVEVDTDGVFFVPPESVADEETEREFVERLSATMPEGISVALDGRYRKMLSYKKKNYALLEYDNRVRIKGSSLISRAMERFGRTYIEQCVDFLLNGDINGLHRLYGEYRRMIQEHRHEVGDFARVETLRESPEQYRQQVESGKRNRAAAYEVALSSGRPYRAGERVVYYITGTDANVRGFENCKAAEEWDPNFPDENTAFYLRRLDELTEKFAEFFHPQDFRSIFSADELFPFESKGIVPLVTPVRPEAEEPPENERKRDFGIWLDQ